MIFIDYDKDALYEYNIKYIQKFLRQLNINKYNWYLTEYYKIDFSINIIIKYNSFLRLIKNNNFHFHF
jgi:hypothetical protein